MNCRDFHARAVDLASNRVSSEERKVLLVHVDRCPECHSLLEQQRDLGLMLAALSEKERSAEAPARIETELSKKFRSVVLSPAVGEGRSVSMPESALRFRGLPAPFAAKRGLPGRPGLSLAAAVVLLGAVALTWSSWEHVPDRVAAPGIEHRSALSQPPEAVRAAPPALAPRQQASVRRSGSRLRPVGPAKPVDTASSEPADSVVPPLAPASPSIPEQQADAASEFLPVGGPELPPVESVQILRVRVPRDILWSFGFPVNPERGREPVQADIVVGQDGMTRAIRFVRE